MFSLLGKKIMACLRSKFLLNWTYENVAYLDLCIKTITSTSKNIHTYYALTVMVLEISRYYIKRSFETIFRPAQEILELIT